MRRNQFPQRKNILEKLNTRKEKMFEFILFLGAISILGLTIINLIRLRQNQNSQN